MAQKSDYLKLHFIVFLWGFSAILGKLVSIPEIEMVFFRAILAAIGMALVILFTKGSFAVNGNQLAQLFGISIIVAIHWITFFGSARVANISVSLVGFATNSLWAAILEPWFNRTRIKRFEVILGLMVLTGLYIITRADFNYYYGLMLGIISGFTSALFSVFNSRLVRQLPAYTITFYQMVGIFVVISLFLPIYQLFILNGADLQLVPAAYDWLWIGLLAGACSVYAYSMAVELMKKLSVFFIQLTLNLEPVYGIIMAVIIFREKEKMNLSFYIGTSIILAAVAIYPYLKKRYDHREKYDA